eukprot:COSAG05_NODE_5229_length_1230_cov_1911.442971_2_plen_199_part_00
MESRIDWSDSEEEEDNDEGDFIAFVDQTTLQARLRRVKAAIAQLLLQALLYAVTIVASAIQCIVILLAALVGLLWGLCLLLCDRGGSISRFAWKATSGVLLWVWQGALYGGVTLPVAAGAFMLHLLRQAKGDISAAAVRGAQFTQEEMVGEQDAEIFDQEGETGGNIKAPRGKVQHKAVKATPVAGQRRRAASVCESR